MIQRWIMWLKKQSSRFLFSQSELHRCFLFLFVQSWRPRTLTICLVDPIRKQLSACILCLFVPSEHHRQLVQLFPETGELSAAARVLAHSAETQVCDGTSPRPPRPLPALRPLLLGPGETNHVWLYHTAMPRDFSLLILKIDRGSDETIAHYYIYCLAIYLHITFFQISWCD